MSHRWIQVSGAWHLAVLALMTGISGCSEGETSSPEAQARKAQEERFVKAKTLFAERCKTAGLVVRRTVKDVEGIELTKVRQPIPWGGKEFFDPMYAEAAMAGEHRGDDYIKQFLMTEVRDRLKPESRGMLTPDNGPSCERCMPLILGYRFVEYRDHADGKFIRASFPGGAARADWRSDFTRSEIQAASARYAIDYEDLVTPADRELWIAGTKLKAIDKKTGEVIAELTKFVWDPGFGTSTTGRLPWQHAGTALSTVCPSYPTRPHGWDSRYFIDTILQPRQRD